MCTNATLSYIDQNCVQSLFPKCFLYALHYDRSGTRKLGFGYYNRKTELVSTLNFLQYYLMIFQSEA